jgi:hypothetical protein
VRPHEHQRELPIKTCSGGWKFAPLAPLSRGPWCRNSFANISMLAVAQGHAAWRVDALGSKTAPAPLFGGVRVVNR